jgi:hypothetical protein
LAAGVPVSVVKKAFSKTGGAALSREFQAVSRYCRLVKAGSDKNAINFTRRDSYGMLEMAFHEGFPGDYTVSLDRNKEKLLGLIDHYARFLLVEPFLSHGDLSISNVIFKEGRLQWIIDWENANDIMPREYDLIYCVTENALCSFARKGVLTGQEVAAYRFLFSEIEARISIDPRAKRQPAVWCLDNAVYFRKSSGIEYRKCPFIAYNDTPDMRHIIRRLDILLGV